MDTADNLKMLKERIATAALRSGRNPDDVQLLAVSKTRSAHQILQAIQAGQQSFGENRIQEAHSKIPAVQDLCQKAQLPPPTWHLVGSLQTNKARFAHLFHMLHSLDSIRLANALQQHFAKLQATCPVFLQVNYSQEKTKSGVHTHDQLQQLADHLLHCPNLQLRGLMTIPPPALNETQSRQHFAQLRQSLQRLQTRLPRNHQCHQLSMGMSADFEWAVAEGSTMVRLGTAIFGARSNPSPPH